MSKSLVILLVLALMICSVAQVRADERYNNDELMAFCGIEQVFIEKLFYDATNANGHIRSLLREDTEDFIPLLFAQCKMENLSILTFAVYAEIGHTYEAGKVAAVTIDMLGKYLYFLKQDLIKAKLFEGMITDREGREYLALTIAVAHIATAHEIFIRIRDKFKQFRQEEQSWIE